MPSQSARTIPQRMLQQVFTVPPPARGLNTTGDYATMPPTDAVDMDNVVSSELGVSVRTGWGEYATNIDGGNVVKTVVCRMSAGPSGVAAPLVGSELFAITDRGIFNVEGGGNMSALAPSIALSGASNAGWCNAVQYTAASGKQYLIVCSETDGAFLYDGLTWAKFTQGTGSGGPGVIVGVDPGLFVQCCVYMGRLCFVRKSSAEMWSLPPGFVGGSAVVFDFGATLKHGGMVLALAVWTMDAGAGLDDHLVVIGSSGDISIYQGTDPSGILKDFFIAGTWYVGQFPVGRRCFTTSGGNVFLLSQYGVVPIAELVNGGLDNVLTSGTDLLKQLRKIQTQLNDDFQTLVNLPGWELVDIPSLALLQVARPSANITEHIQYVFQRHSMAWSRILDVPATTFCQRLNETYGGTADGRVLRVFSGYTDGKKIDGTGASEIRARCTPAFSTFDSATVKKQAHMIRLQWVAKANPQFAIRMNRDYELNPLSGTQVAKGFVGSLWDHALWDVDVWSGGRAAFGEWRSVRGMGFALAPTIFISSTQPTTLASIEYMTEAGGPL